MNTTEEITQGEAQEQQEQAVLETTKHKTRGTLTIKPGTMQESERLIEERGMQGTGAHDRLVVDLMTNDTIAHQMYALLQPLAQELGQDEGSPVATLQALIAAYRAGSSAAAPDVAALLDEVKDKDKPVDYLRGLVQRDRKFKTAIEQRHAHVDYVTASMQDLRTKYKTAEAATERFRRAVDAIIAHNLAQTDPLHLWYINSAAIRDLVGGQNELVQKYLDTRKEEIEAHHRQLGGLTPRQNYKPQTITEDITVE